MGATLPQIQQMHRVLQPHDVHTCLPPEETDGAGQNGAHVPRVGDSHASL